MCQSTCFGTAQSHLYSKSRGTSCLPLDPGTRIYENATQTHHIMFQWPVREDPSIFFGSNMTCISGRLILAGLGELDNS